MNKQFDKWWTNKGLTQLISNTKTFIKNPLDPLLITTIKDICNKPWDASTYSPKLSTQRNLDDYKNWLSVSKLLEEINILKLDTISKLEIQSLCIEAWSNPPINRQYLWEHKKDKVSIKSEFSHIIIQHMLDEKTQYTYAYLGDTDITLLEVVGKFSLEEMKNKIIDGGWTLTPFIEKELTTIEIESEWDIGLPTTSKLSLKETQQKWKDEFDSWAASETGYTYEEAIAENLLIFSKV